MAKGKRRKATGKGAGAGFVGRDGSPVLDLYPPKDPALSVRGPPSPATPRAAPTALAPATPVPTSGGSAPPSNLISLDKPFDVDDFARLLGSTDIQVTVPREDLLEVLRRITDFMGFGIYVYSVRVHPASDELLKRFVVELHRVDYSPGQRAWIPFEERGSSDNPFGPSGSR